MQRLPYILLALAAGCGKAPPAAQPSGPPWVRPTWTPIGDPPPPGGREVARFSAADIDSAWRVAQGEGQVTLPVASDGAPLRLTGSGARLASLPTELTASDLHRAVVTLDVPAGERELFRFSFQTNGRTRAYTDVAAVEGIEGPETLDLDLAQVRPLEGGIDRLVFETLGKAESCEIHGVTFFKQSLLTFLPTAHSGSGLLHVGDDGRRGVAVDASYPATMEIEAPAGATLEFSYRVGSPGTLGDAALVIEGLEAAPVRLALARQDPTDKSPGWRTFRRPLQAPLQTVLELRVDGGPENAFTYVADAGALSSKPASRPGGGSPPTVLLITSDTHRGQLLGVTSGGLVRTPALDALAARGLVFTNASSTSNSTNPSHIALMTGLHPRDTHVVTNRDPLAREASTLAEHFAAAGWRTAAAFSAFHLGDDTSGLGQGFDRYDGPGAPTGMNFDAFAGAASAVRNGEVTVARALEQLRSAKSAPLFLWVHVFDAHAPYLPRGEFDGRYRPAGLDPKADGPGLPLPPKKVPRFLSGVRDPQEPWNQYRALVDYVDYCLTPLLTTPRVAGGITAFTSDHGESFGEHDIWWNHAGVYPATTHVPLVLAWPGARAAQVNAPVEQRSLGRTILSLAQLHAPDFSGADLSAAEGSPASPRFSLGYYARSASIDDGRWYLVLHLQEEANDTGTHTWLPGEVELYDREGDPDCANNLVAADLPRARLMRTRLLEWLAAGDPQGLKGEYHVKAAIDNALSELGYAGTGNDGAVWYDPARGDAFLDVYGAE